MRKYVSALLVPALVLVALGLHSRRSAETSTALPLRSGLSRSDRVTANINETNLPRALIMYSELIGRTELKTDSLSEQLDEFFGGRLSHWHLIKLPSRAPSGIEFHRDGLFTVGELKDHLDGLFAANGLLVIPDGKRYFRVIKSNKPGENSPLPKGWGGVEEGPDEQRYRSLPEEIYPNTSAIASFSAATIFFTCSRVAQ